MTFPKSWIWMMFGCVSCAASFASLRDTRRTVCLWVRCGRMRLSTTIFSNPSGPICRARKISAIPPTAMRSRRRYLPNCCSRISAAPPRMKGRVHSALRPAWEAGRVRGPKMDEKLQEIEQRFERLTADLGNPEVIGDRSRFSQVAKERAQLEPLVEAFREYKQAKKQRDEMRAALDDAELRDLAMEELPGLHRRVEELNEKLKILLLPKDPNDERSVILEVRAGAGGDEAGLFAAELLRMYLRYAERKGWKAALMATADNAPAPIKDATATLKGARF